MTAYGGYVAAQPVDFSGLISDFGAKAIAIQKANKAKEEKKQLLQQKSVEKQTLKQEERDYKEQQDAIKNIERQEQEDKKIIDKPIPFTGSKTMDDLSAKVVPLVADANFTLSKLMKEDPSKSAELSAKKSNLNRDFQSYVEVPKTAIEGKKYLTEQAKNQSPIGQMLGGKYNSILDVGRKNVSATQDGRLIFFDTNEKGEEIPDSGVPISAIANYGAYADNDVDYDKEIDDLKLGEYSQITGTGGRSQIETKSAKLNPQYENVTNSYARSKTATAPDIARVLVKLGGYGAYVDDVNNIPSQPQIDPKTGEESYKPIIKFELTENGGYYPIVTEGMRKEAEAILKQKIDASISVDVNKTRNPDLALGNGGEKGPKDIPKMDIVEAKKKIRQIESKEDSDNIFNRVPGFKAKLENMAKKSGYKNVTIVDLPGGGLGIRATVGAEKPSKAKVIQEFNNGESIYSWRNGLDPKVGASEYSELSQENKNDYLEIANAGKEQMFKRAGKQISETPKETIYVDVSVLKKNNPNSTVAELKKYIMDQNKGKKIRWQNGK